MKRSILALNTISILLMSAVAYGSQPLVTDDTGTMGVMKFQLETGAEFGWDKQNSNGVTTSAPCQLLNLTFTAGVLDALDLIMTLPFSWQQVEVNGLKTYDNGGLNDLSLAFKWRFLELGPASFAFKPAITFPSGDYNQGLGNGRPAYGTTLISTMETKPVTVSANVGYTFQKYTDADKNANRENLWNLSLCGSVEIFKGLRALAEIATATNASSASNVWPTFITGGITYSVLDNLDIDLGVKGGLTYPAPDIALLAGFTVRMP
jgi:hypothetical protein